MNITCDKCGSPMVECNEVNGTFWDCSAFPDCKNAKIISDEDGSICDKCGAQMVIRTAQQGKTPGNQFWACSAYPNCKSTKPLREQSKPYIPSNDESGKLTLIDDEILGELKNIRLSEEQQDVYAMMEHEDNNLFVTGKAGTGKSVLLKYFVANTSKQVIVLAPTGVAAMNVGGQTIHSRFAFNHTVLEPVNINVIDDNTAWILQNIDVCVIDEISMVRVDLMESISRKFQLAMKRAIKLEECDNRKSKLAIKSKLPFGGVRIIVFGDLYQLPPVVADGEIQRYLDDTYGGEFFFFAPAVKELVENGEFNIVELEYIHRQKDKVFRDMLNEVRVGQISENTLTKFNERKIIPFPVDDVLTLATKNSKVEEVNNSKLRALSGKEYTYEATDSGNIRELTKAVDKTLHLKVGAQVVMLRNDPLKQGRWVNGTIAEIAELSENEIKVKVNGVVHRIEQTAWHTLEYKYDEKSRTMNKGIVAERIQYPIRLAWALTVHKSQGKTYKKVRVDLDSGAFVHGQTYVALSRCETLENLYLVELLKKSDVIVDNRVVSFINKNKVPIHVKSGEHDKTIHTENGDENKLFEEAPACNACGKPMIRRTNRQSGNVFWGCSSYPKCSYTEPVNNNELMVESLKTPEKHSKTIVLLSCSKAKRTYPCESRLLYDASNLFSKSLAYAQSLSNDIFVLSSKYGLVDLDTIVEPYDETLNDKSSDELSDWGEKVIGQLKQRVDIDNSTFIILAGKNYYNPIYNYLKNVKLPLFGLSFGERLQKLDELLNTKSQSQDDICLKLHKLFNAMPYFRWNTIDMIDFDNGIYVLFEKGETYNGINRIVRVGTHRSNNRLRARLKNHFIDKNKDGSIFRKNIGRAILNKYGSNYLDIWNIDSREKNLIMSLGNRYNPEFQKKIENEVSEYMCNNLFFICFPVESSEERMRLEEGIIATLNISDDFTASPNWFGNNSPEWEIVNSGMWLKQGLDGTPLTENEYIQIEKYCSNNARATTTTEASSNIIDKSEIKHVIAPRQSKSVIGLKTSDVVDYIKGKFANAKANGAKSIVLISGDIHKELGLTSRMPTVCGAMRKLMKSTDIIHYSPPSGNGATLKIEYFLVDDFNKSYKQKNEASSQKGNTGGFVNKAIKKLFGI